MHLLGKFHTLDGDISDPALFFQDQDKDHAERQKNDETDHDQSLRQRIHSPIDRRADRKSDHADDRQCAGIKEHIQNEDNGRLGNGDPVTGHEVGAGRLAGRGGRRDRGKVDIRGRV